MLPFDDVDVIVTATFASLSRSVRQRVRRRIGWQSWANDGVAALNELGSGVREPKAGQTSSSGQRSCLQEIQEAYKSVGPLR